MIPIAVDIDQFFTVNTIGFSTRTNSSIISYYSMPYRCEFFLPRELFNMTAIELINFYKIRVNKNLCYLHNLIYLSTIYNISEKELIYYTTIR